MMLTTLRRRSRLTVTLIALLFSYTPLTHAQDAAAPAAALVAPRLLHGAAPTYPDEERERGAPATVVLTLSIDKAGAVTDAVVATSGGASFDAAALKAARDLTFAPATRDGAPIASKIAFKFDFAIEPPPEPAAPPAVDPGAAPEIPPEPPPPPPTEVVDIDVRGARPPREATMRVLEAREIAKLPGTNGDALHAVENLPGVGRGTGVSSNIIVRGSAPEDTGVFLDGVWIPNAFHFGGITSVVPTELLDRLDFYPGNFSPQYGRQMGGIIDIGVRSPKKDRLGGLLQFDLLDGRMMIEGPLSKSTRFLVAGRRSWVDAWITPLLKNGGNGVTAAPVYYDYQAMIEHDFSSKTTGRLLFFGADDRLALTLASPSADDPTVGGDLSQSSTFYRLQARVDTRLSDDVRFINMASIGVNNEHFRVGALSYDGHFDVLDARSDLRAKITRGLTAVAGIDFLAGGFDVKLLAPPAAPDGQVAGPAFASPKNELNGSGTLMRPAAYAMLEVAPVSRVKLMPGVRVDYASEVKSWTVDPRFTTRVDVASGYPRTTVKGGVGVFHQPPQPFQSLPPFGSPSVKPSMARHYSVGVEQELTRDVEVSVEGFYKDLQSLVVAEAGQTKSGNDYLNTGTGRAYGAEVLLKWKPGGRFFGWVAYTLSRSERRDDATQPYTTFDYDQTHILNALGSYDLGRGWTLGARWRYVTGNPYTPYRGGAEDFDAGAYAAIPSPLTNSARVAPFHSLDVRVDKTWTFTGFKLSAYLDVRNAYYRKNPEAMTYNYNYSQSSIVSGLPILPVLGLRGEL
jgi:TonB family protein